MLRWFLRALLSSGMAFAAPVTVYYYNRMPYYGEVAGRPAGLLLDIASLVFQQARIPYRFAALPVRRITETLRVDPDACSVGWFRTPEREARFLFSGDYIYQDKPFCVIVRKDRSARLPADPGIRDILRSGLELGLVDGFRYGDWLEGNLAEYAPRHQEVAVGDDTSVMYRMLMGGRFDYMFAGSEEAAYVLASNADCSVRLDRVQVADAPAGNKRYFLFGPNFDPALLARIDAAIPAVRRSRAYRRILQASGF